MSQLNNYQIGFYAVIAIVSCIIIVYIVRYIIKQIPEDTFKKSQGKPEGPSEPDTSILESLKSIPVGVLKFIGMIVFLVTVYLLFFRGQNLQPKYKLVSKIETPLKKGEVLHFTIAKDDSIHLSTIDLPHLVIWQGSTKYIGEEQHHTCIPTKEKGSYDFEISLSSRYLRIKPCEKHGKYGTLVYSIYRPTK